MNSEAAYPIIFGCIAIKGALAFDKSIVDVREAFRLQDILVVYQLGSSSEVHVLDDGLSSLALFGRIYNPVEINPFVNEVEGNLRYLAGAELNEVQGSFTIVRISTDTDITSISIITDKYGLRPILYFQKENHLFFSTHLTGLKILLGDRLPGISTDALLHYYNFGVTSNEQTILEGIKKVPPGSTLQVENSNVSVKPYFSLASLYHPEEFVNLSEQEICTAIDSRLLAAVRNRISGDGPVGVSLSGGVDSGYIAQKMVQSGAKTIGYNIAYGQYYDEFDRVDFLAEALGIEVRKISVSPNQVIENFEYVNAISSEPVGFNNATLRFVALEAQKDGVHTLFDGDGADRLFLGMNRHLLFKKVIRAYYLLKKIGLLSLIKPILLLAPGDEFRKMYIHFQNWNKNIGPYAERDLGGLSLYDAAYERRLYDLAVKRFQDRFGSEFGVGDFGQFFTYQAIHMCPEMFFHAPAEIQTELGFFPVPAFWDDDLVSLAISLPTEMKLRRKTTKYILRKAAAQNLEPKYWMLPKIGLQSSSSYAVHSEEGRGWRDRQLKKVRDSAEYKILREIVPGGKVQPDKLIEIMSWKERHDIS